MSLGDFIAIIVAFAGIGGMSWLSTESAVKAETAGLQADVQSLSTKLDGIQDVLKIEFAAGNELLRADFARFQKDVGDIVDDGLKTGSDEVLDSLLMAADSRNVYCIRITNVPTDGVIDTKLSAIISQMEAEKSVIYAAGTANFEIEMTTLAGENADKVQAAYEASQESSVPVFFEIQPLSKADQYVPLQPTGDIAQ